MIRRRDFLGALLGGVGAAACAATGRGLARPESGERGSEPPLALDPIIDLVPAAGLVWLVEARPRELLADPVLGPALAAIASGDRLDAFARRHGQVDLRQAEQVAVASTTGAARATLALAMVHIEPGRVEAAFTARARNVDGRAVERGVTRFWGTVGEEREQVALFGQQGVGIERGGLGPLQAAIYFAEGRLKRSLPALRAQPLASAAARLGEAPLRGFAPGPFEGDWAGGLGGLLGATTAVAVRLRAAARGADGALALRFLRTGAWGADAAAAALRLEEAFHVLTEDPLGRLAGLDRPVDGPRVAGDAEALVLDVALDPVRMSRGVRAATEAPLAEIMAF
jgi:hypothetical protein